MADRPETEDTYTTWWPGIGYGPRPTPPDSTPATMSADSGAASSDGTVTPPTSRPSFSTVQTPEQREQELRDALAYAAKVEQGEAQLPISEDPTAFKRSIEDIKSKVGLVDAYRSAGQDMTPEARALVFGRAAPFVDLSAGTINVTAALKAGIPESELRATGIGQASIARTKRFIRQSELNKKVQSEVGRIQAADINARATAADLAWQQAADKLQAAGFREGELPKTWIGPPGMAQPRQFTIPSMAEFVRNNPDGISILRDYNFTDETIAEVGRYNQELKSAADRVADMLGKGKRFGGNELALGQAIQTAVITVEPLGATQIERGTLGGLYKDVKTGKVLSEKEVVAAKWNALSSEQKLAVAALWDKDYFKGSYFAEITKGMSDVAAQAGIVGQIAYGAILPVTMPVAKQTTLEAAKTQLADNYKTELSVLSGYVGKDGAVDMGRLNTDLKDDKKVADILQRTGYDNADDLKNNLEYYNYATRVTPKEWATAGLVGALDVMGMGMMTGAGAGAAVGATRGGLVAVVGRGMQEAVPLALAGVTLPDTIKALASPKVSVSEKVLAGVTQLLLMHGLAGPAIRGIQFLKITERADYIPLRSMSMEKSTARVPFTELQLLAMRKAGVSEANIIQAGTRINEQLVAGKKVAIVKLGPVTVRVKNTTYQQSQTMSLFNATPDVTVFDRGGKVPLIKKFYTAAKVAIEPMERSYLSGQKATTPGIIEIKLADPGLIKKLFPQERLIGGGRVIEPEMAIPSMEKLHGMGYMLEPIPGRAGRGTSFDATLGPLEIRRFSLVKIVDNPTGLKTVRVGGSGPAGTVALSDLHGTRNYRSVFNDINSAYDKPVIKGDPGNPASWHWVGEQQTIAVLGDSIDRGSAYEIWRNTFNRLADEAKSSGGKVERLLGNHELAYLSDDAIKGIEYTDATRALIKKGLQEDIASGKVRAAIESDGKLYTHAGVSLGVFKEFTGASAKTIADDLNRGLIDAVERNNFSDKMFAKGRVERGNSLSSNERSQGGIFWLRPQEATAAELDLGFTQAVGHNPGKGVRQLWGDNFVEVDVSRRTGGHGVYADTPFARTESVPISTRAVSPVSPRIGRLALEKMKVEAIRDTIADVFMGWDGRIQAIERIKSSKVAVDALIRDIDRRIEARKIAGDSIGVRYLERQKAELISPTGSDYLYGGIGFWRDIVMGRQNSVRVLNTIGQATKGDLGSLVAIISGFHDRISTLSDRDVAALFGRHKSNVLRDLDTNRLSTENLALARKAVAHKIQVMADIIDEGLERNIVPHLNSDTLASRYSQILQDRVASQAELRGYYVGEGRVDRITEYPESYREGVAATRGGRLAGKEQTRSMELRETRMSPPSRVPQEDATRVPELARIVDVPVRVPATGEDIRTPIIEIIPRPPVIRIPPLETPVIEPPPVTPPPPDAGIKLSVGASPIRKQVPDGSIAWQQGVVYKYSPPLWDQPKPITLRHPPIGFVGSGTPAETIQIIGTARNVPAAVRVDLGFADIMIKNGHEISFEGKGLNTNVGTRMDSPTMGMSILENGGTDLIPNASSSKNPRGFNHKVVKKVTKRKTSNKERWYRSMTTVGSVR